jgi:putative membrane protein
MRFDLKDHHRKGPAAWVTQWLVSAVALALSAHFVEGVQLPAGTRDAALSVLGAAAALGLLNLLLKPLLLLVTLPVNILTLGLFTLVINGVVLLAAAALVPGLAIHGFWSSVLAAFLVSLFSLLLNALLGGSSLSVRAGKG